MRVDSAIAILEYEKVMRARDEQLEIERQKETLSNQENILEEKDYTPQKQQLTQDVDSEVIDENQRDSMEPTKMTVDSEEVNQYFHLRKLQSKENSDELGVDQDANFDNWDDDISGDRKEEYPTLEIDSYNNSP